MFPSLQLRIPQLSTRNKRKDAARESPEKYITFLDGCHTEDRVFALGVHWHRKAVLRFRDRLANSDYRPGSGNSSDLG